MGFEVTSTVTIAAPPETVWPLLIDPTTWKSWWPDCQAATTRDHRNLREGSQLEVVLQPKHGKATFTPRVDLITEHKTLTMTARGALLQTSVSWHLHGVDMGTRVTIHGAFAGFGATVMKLFGSADTAQFSLHGNLRGLKRVAERLA